MNDNIDRDVASRGSREEFLGFLHEYLVQNGCTQTAMALAKEASVKSPEYTPDLSLYDWWCFLMSSHNMPGVPSRQQGDMPMPNWSELAAMNGMGMPNMPNMTNMQGIPNLATMQNAPNMSSANMANLQGMQGTTAPNRQYQQQFKAPASARQNSIHSSTSNSGPQSQQVTPMLRPQPKPRAKAPKASQAKAKAQKGSPILLPGVAPLVVVNPPNAANGAANQRNGRRNSAAKQTQRAPQMPPTPLQPPETPTWDTSQLLMNNFAPDIAPQRPPQDQGMGHPMSQLMPHGATHPNGTNGPGGPGGPPRGSVQHQGHKMQSHVGPPHHSMPDGQIQEQQRQQFIQRQQLLQQQQQQQQFLFQQQKPPMQAPHARAPGGMMPMQPMQPNFMGANPSVGPAHGPIVPTNMAVDDTQTMRKPSGIDLMGNPDDAFLDDMMGGNMYMNNGLAFTGEGAFDGSGPMAGANMYAPTNFHEKGADHAGMIDRGGVSGNPLMSANYGMDMNAGMPLMGADEQGVSMDAGQDNFRMGSNFGFGSEGGDFFSEGPLTIPL